MPRLPPNITVLELIPKVERAQGILVVVVVAGIEYEGWHASDQGIRLVVKSLQAVLEVVVARGSRLAADQVVDVEQVLQDLLVLREPRVLQGLLGRRTVLRVRLDHPHHQVSALRRVRRQELLNSGSFALYISLEQFLEVFAAEQVAAGDQVEKDGAQAEYIGMVGVALAFEDLGGDVARRPALMKEHFVLGVEGGESKVRDPDLVVGLILDGVDEHVVKLDIPVYDLLPLEEIQREEHLLHDDTHLALFKLHSLHYHVHQRAL